MRIENNVLAKVYNEDIKNGEFIIPSVVTSIGASAFNGLKSLKSVKIGNNVTNIGTCAFYNCTSLKNIVIGNGVQIIENRAFCNTKYYNNETNWENGVLYIGKYLIDSLIDITTCFIKQGTKLIANCAFINCALLTKVDIPDSVESIGDYAFEHCDLLKSLTISKGVTSIGNWLFDHCLKFTNINVDEDNQCYSSKDGVLYNKNKTNILCYPEGRFNRSYTIPDGVQNIGDYAFYNCTTLKRIIAPDGIQSIGKHAFFNCPAKLFLAGTDSGANLLNANNQPEFFGQIIDVFEDFLEEKGIEIPNEERDSDIGEDLAHIFGDDYDAIKNSLEIIMKNWKIIKED